MTSSFFKRNILGFILLLGVFISFFFARNHLSVASFLSRFEYPTYTLAPNIKFSAVSLNSGLGIPSIKFQYPEDCQILYSLNNDNPLNVGHKLNGSILKLRETDKIIPFIGSIVNSYHWQPPFLSTSSFFIRLVCVNNNSKERSEEMQIIIPDVEQQNLGLPIVSVQVDKKELISFFDGIAILGFSDGSGYDPALPWWEQKGNFSDRGKKNKVKASFSIISREKKRFEGEGKLGISGNASRGFPKKSFSFSISKGSGKNAVNYFSDTSFCSDFTIRSGSNDWNRAIVRDVLVTQFSAKCFPELNMHAEPIILFINGEYFGLYFLYEKINENFIALKYKVSKNDIRLFEDAFNNSNSPELQKEINTYTSFLLDQSVPHYLKIKWIKENFDLINFYKYVSFQIIFANSDWPDGNNKMYKIHAKNKWNFIVNDFDLSMGFSKGEDHSNLDVFLKLRESKSVTALLFNTLMQDVSCKDDFLNTLDLLIANELHPLLLKEELNKLAKLVSPAINDHILRWRSHSSFSDWNGEINRLHAFFNARNNFLKKTIQNERGAKK